MSYAIFLSHSSADNASAANLKARLQTHGYEAVFLDFDPEDGIPAGRHWEQELFHRMSKCVVVIVLCSEAAMASKWVFAELVLAIHRGKPVIPVRIADCELPPLLSRYQVVDLRTDSDGAYTRILRGLSEAGADSVTGRLWDLRRSPYPGLVPFDELDAAVFFGRRRQVLEVIESLASATVRGRAGAESVLLVHGASGVGKSSFVRAGVTATLRRRSGWIVTEPVRPGIGVCDSS